MEGFCVHAQQFLIVILDNKVFQRWIICACTQILSRDMEMFSQMRRNSKSDFGRQSLPTLNNFHVLANPYL